MISWVSEGTVPACTAFHSEAASGETAPQHDRRGVHCRLLPPTTPGSRLVLARPNLGLPAARAPLQAMTLRTLQASQAQTSVLPQTAAASDIFNHPQPFLSPGIFIPSASAGHYGPGFTAVPFGLIARDSVLLSSTAPDVLTGLLFMSGATLGAIGVITYGHISTGLLGTLGNGFVGLGSSMYIRHLPLLNVAGFTLTGWRDYLGIGLNYTWADSATGALAIAAVQIGKTARRDVTDMGVYRGEHAAALAQQHGVSNTHGLRRVQHTVRTGESYAGRFGGGSVTVSGLLRIDYQRGRETTYRTFMTPEQERDILFEGRGLGLFLRNKGRALGWVRDPVHVPDVHDPNALPLGDELSLTQSRTWMFGALLGNLSGWVGANTFRKNDMEIVVRRVGLDHVEVVVTPLESRALLGYILQPFGPHVALRRSRAQAVRAGFVFDLREPAAQSAYSDIVAGVLPGIDPRKIRALGAAPPETAIQERVAQAQSLLPTGVRCSFIQNVQGRIFDAGGGLKWLFIPHELLPHGWENGITWHRHHGHERQAASDGQAVLTSDGRTCAIVSERLMFGLKSHEVSATARWLQPGDGQEHFMGLSLRANIDDSYVRGDGFNRRMVRRINRNFGTHLPLAERPHRHEQRRVQVERGLDEVDIHRLATLLTSDLGASAVAPTELGVLRAMGAAARARVPYTTVHHLLNRLATTTDLHARSTMIERYTQRYGLRGMAAIHHLLDGDSAQLQVATQSSTYDTALKAAELLQLQDDPTHTTQTTDKELARRWREMDKVKTQLRRAQADVEDDGLLDPASRNVLRAQLREAAARVDAAARLDANTAWRLRDYLQRRVWRRRWQQRALRQLS